METQFRTYINKNETRFGKLEIFQYGIVAARTQKPRITIINHTCTPLIFLYSLLWNHESSMLMSSSWHMSYEQRMTHKDNKTSQTLLNRMIILPIKFLLISAHCITRKELHSTFKMLSRKENTDNSRNSRKYWQLTQETTQAASQFRSPRAVWWTRQIYWVIWQHSRERI